MKQVLDEIIILSYPHQKDGWVNAEKINNPHKITINTLAKKGLITIEHINGSVWLKPATSEKIPPL